MTNPNQLSRTELAPPSLAHWLGTTQIGQDVFEQLVVSTRASLAIGIGAGLLATVVSVVIGISGGYAGGFLDEALSLVSNVVLVIPTLPLIIVIIADVKSNGLVPLIVVIALTSWAASARVLRAQTLSVRNREYVLAARAAGERPWRVVFVEILPNELPIIVSNFIFATIFAILTQAALAFIGLGDPTLLDLGEHAQPRVQRPGAVGRRLVVVHPARPVHRAARHGPGADQLQPGRAAEPAAARPPAVPVQPGPPGPSQSGRSQSAGPVERG